jgi:hypothetical protein
MKWKVKQKSQMQSGGRHSNRRAGYYCIRHRMGTSFGQPVHIDFYLKPLLDSEGKTDREKIIERFNEYTPTADGVINSPVK